MESTNNKPKRSYALEYYYRHKTEKYIDNVNRVDPYEVFEWNGKPITLLQLARKAKCSVREMYDRCNRYKTIEECLRV